MGFVIRELLRTPHRLTERYAKGLCGLALVTLLWTVIGGAATDGWQRVVYVVAIGSIGLGNLLWGLGSLLPEARGGRTARALARSLFIVMLITLPIALVFLFINRS